MLEKGAFISAKTKVMVETSVGWFREGRGMGQVEVEGKGKVAKLG